MDTLAIVPLFPNYKNLDILIIVYNLINNFELLFTLQI